MKRPSFKAAIEWIAFNDEPKVFNQEEMSNLISVLLIADIFDISPELVAKKVIAKRLKTKEE